METYLKRIGSAMDKLIVIIYAAHYIRHDRFWQMSCQQIEVINIRVDQCIQYLYDEGIDVSATQSVIDNLSDSMDDCIVYIFGDADTVDDIGAFEDINVFVTRMVAYYMQLCYVIRSM